jgi:N utilization substance protein A
LSLAIGRKGQNVRLASQLTGWKLDIISESKFKALEEEALAAFREIDGMTDDVARAMYRVGFRALEEVAEAGAEELSAIDGVGGVPEAEALSESAAATMERLRFERYHSMRTRREPPTERELLRLVTGVGLRTLQFLEEGGFRTLRDIVREDPDRLAIRSGLSNKKARLVQAAAMEFLSAGLPQLERERQAYREHLVMQERAAIVDAQAHGNSEASVDDDDVADDDDIAEDDEASAGAAAEAEQ